MEKKLRVLADIARKLNEAGVTWAVGGSALLYLKGVVASFGDIDIMIICEDMPATAKLFERFAKPTPADARFATKAILKCEIDGVDVDVIAGFAIVSGGTEHDCSLDKDGVAERVTLNGVSVPLQSISDWRRYYMLMGRTSRVAEIDAAEVL